MDSAKTELAQRTLSRLEQLEELPTLPAVVNRVMELAQDEDVSIRELKQVIMSDPPLSAKLLRVANSAAYSRRNRAESIDQAIVTIGLNPLIEICTTIGVLSTLNAWEVNHLERDQLWRHSLATAFLAKGLEMRKAMRGDKTPDMFLAGLLHNVGWIVVDDLFPDELGTLLQQQRELGSWKTELEVELLGLSHAEIGAQMLRQWDLPEGVITVVAGFDNPAKAGVLEAHAALLGLASFLAPYRIPLEQPLTELHPKIPAMVGEHSPENFEEMLRDRYSSHVEQAKALADRMMDFAVGS